MASDETDQALGTHPIEAREGGIMDDVLERAEMFVRQFDTSGSFPNDGRAAASIIRPLAAEVRALRAKVERLALAARLLVELDEDYCACDETADPTYKCATCQVKDEIDAAMPSRGEDAGA